MTNKKNFSVLTFSKFKCPVLAKKTQLDDRQLSNYVQLFMTFCFLLLSSPNLFSQVCNCPDGSLVIGSPDEPLASINLTDSGLPDGVFTGCAKVYGTLVINKNYQFKHSQVFMESGAKILVKPTRRITIDSSRFEGCTTMWQGFHLQNSVKINMQNSMIKDAQYAIKAENYTYLVLKNNVFDANYVGVYVPEKPGYSSNKIHLQNDDIDQNTFTQLSDYKSPFIGQFPHPGNSPFAGIYFTDVKSITIGQPYNSAAPIKNYFKHLRFGLIIEDCKLLSFSGGQFESLVYHPDEPYAYGGIAFDIKGSDRVDIQHCNTKHVRYGFTLTGNDRLGIKDNRICSDEFGLFLFNSQSSVNIERNVLESSRESCIAIGVGSSPAPVKITNNTFIPYLAGIQADFFAGTLEVEDNTFQFKHEDEVNNRHGFSGLRLTGKTTIKGNEFIAVDSVAIHVEQAIILNLCENVFVKENYVSGASSIDSYWSGGILSSYSPNNTFCCNTIENTRTGVLFIGACTDTKLANTVFGGRQSAALYLSNAEISPQHNTGNDWSQITDYGAGLTADIWFNGIPQLMDNSRMTIMTYALPNGYDKVIVPNGENPEDWIELAGKDSLCGQQFRCQEDDLRTFLVEDTDISEQLAEALFTPQTFSPEATLFYWEKQKNLYRHLYHNPQARIRDKHLAAFFRTHQQGVLGQLFEIENGSMQLTSMHSIEEIEQLINDNHQIIPENDYQEQEKIFNQLYLNTIAKGNFLPSEEQKQQILTLASMDYRTGGAAVWLAQGLARLLKLATSFPIIDAPMIADIPVEDSEKSNLFDVNIFPNPTSDVLRFSLNSNDNIPTTVSLFDSFGRQVKFEKWSADATAWQWSLADLSAGTYFVKVELEHGGYWQERVVVVR